MPTKKSGFFGDIWNIIKGAPKSIIESMIGETSKQTGGLLGSIFDRIKGLLGTTEQKTIDTKGGGIDIGGFFKQFGLYIAGAVLLIIILIALMSKKKK